jgi:hypothetical protein
VRRRYAIYSACASSFTSQVRPSLKHSTARFDSTEALALKCLTMVRTQHARIGASTALDNGYGLVSTAPIANHNEGLTTAAVRLGACVTNAPSEYDGAELYER